MTNNKKRTVRERLIITMAQGLVLIGALIMIIGFGDTSNEDPRPPRVTRFIYENRDKKPLKKDDDILSPVVQHHPSCTMEELLKPVKTCRNEWMGAAPQEYR